MSTLRLCLTLLLACAVAAAAIPAAPDDFQTTLEAFRKAKNKEERLAVLKGKDGEEIEVFLLKLFKAQDGPVSRGEFGEAAQLQQWAEEVITLVTDADRRELCELVALFGRGRLEQVQEHLNEAVTVYKKMLVAAAKPQFKAMKPVVLTNLAAAQSKQGDYLGGLKTIKEARDGLAGLDDSQREIVEAALIGNLGQLHMEIGDYAEAETAFKESLKLAEKHKDAATARVARLNLATLHVHRARYAEAIKAYESLLEDSRKSGNKVMEGTILNNLGMALIEHGRAGEAIRRVDEARKLAVALKQRRAEGLALYNLAIVHWKLDNYEDAERYLRDSIEQFKAVGDKVGIARCLKLAGMLGLIAGKKAEADKALAEAIDAAKASGSKTETAELTFFVALQFLEERELKKAEPLFAQAIKVFQELGDSRRVLIAHQMRLLCLGATDDPRYDEEFAALKTDAFKSGDEYALLEFGYIAALGSLLTKDLKTAAFIAEENLRLSEKRRLLIEDPHLQVRKSADLTIPRLCAILAAAQAGNGDQDAAFRAIERAKGWVLNQLLSRGRVVQTGMKEDEQEKEVRLREAVKAAAGKATSQMRFANAEPGKADALKKELTKAEANYEEFQRDLMLAHPDLPTKRGELPPVDLVALQKTVFSREPELAIISYIATQDRTLIAVVTAGDKPDGPAHVVVHTVMTGGKELGDAAESFWKACQNRKAGRPLSDELYKWLIEPVEKDIKGKKHLLIVPCHPILTVPFQALAADKDSPYLIEQFAVSYAPSVSALLEMRKRGDKVRGPGRADRLQVLALGGAKFTRDLEDLPESGPEAEAVAKTFGDRSRVLLGEKATRPEVLKVMPDARFLHFATHGEINPPRPLFSALAVTPTGENDDGRLYAHDVLNLNLTAEMVVLSACDSGRGKDYRGEGTVGLAWAFFVAGAPAVVVSQWKVSDVATADLMREFYARLRAGAEASKAEALRQASLKLLKENKTKHPMFWAPFVLIGDWRK